MISKRHFGLSGLTILIMVAINLLLYVVEPIELEYRPSTARALADIELYSRVIERYKEDNNAYPESLSVLVPKYVKNIVSDPCLLYTSPSPRDRG